MKLQVDRLGKERGSRRVLVDVHLDVGDGEIVALVGPNGAGKSTLLAIVAGTLPAGEGEVRLDDSSLEGTPALRRNVGFVPEGADPLPHLAVGELLALTASLRRASAPPAALLERTPPAGRGRGRGASPSNTRCRRAGA